MYGNKTEISVEEEMFKLKCPYGYILEDTHALECVRALFGQGLREQTDYYASYEQPARRPN